DSGGPGSPDSTDVAKGAALAAHGRGGRCGVGRPERESGPVERRRAFVRHRGQVLDAEWPVEAAPGPVDRQRDLLTVSASSFSASFASGELSSVTTTDFRTLTTHLGSGSSAMRYQRCSWRDAATVSRNLVRASPVDSWTAVPASGMENCLFRS